MSPIPAELLIKPVMNLIGKQLCQYIVLLVERNGEGRLQGYGGSRIIIG
jgi:hypothetical protein